MFAKFWTLPPLVRIFTQSISTVVRKIGRFSHPPPPLGANVINGSPLRWFTCEIEMDLCGHATLAAAHVIFNFYEPVRHFQD